MDLTSLSNVKTYGNVASTTDDALISGLITAYSASIETLCNGNLGTKVFTNKPVRGIVDRDGLMTVYLQSPAITALTSATYRLMAWPLTSATALDVTQVDIESHSHGTILRFLGSRFNGSYRGKPIRVLVTYTGGYTGLPGTGGAAPMPYDLEMAARRIVWWAYKKREAPFDKTAIPETGQVIIPSGWPKDAMDILKNYMSVVSEN